MGLAFSTMFDRREVVVHDKNAPGGKRSFNTVAEAVTQSDELLQLRVDLDDLHRQFYAFVSASNHSDERGSY